MNVSCEDLYGNGVIEKPLTELSESQLEQRENRQFLNQFGEGNQ